MISKKLLLNISILLLPVLFVLIFGRYGYEDSDSGFLVGMGWRILNGELPYRDFFYVRPPLAPYISAFYLLLTPEYGQVLWMRLINYYQLLAQVALTLYILKKNYNFDKLKINFNFFLLLSFLITSTGTLYFHWHTTDGIFLAVLGFFFISALPEKLVNFFISGFLLVCAALIKQNFILAPILGLMYVLYVYKSMYKLSISFFSGAILGVGGLYFYLVNFDLLELFVSQTFGVTKLSDLVFAGLISYFINHDFFFFYFCLVATSFIITVCVLRKDHEVNEKLQQVMLAFSIVLASALNVSYILLSKKDSLLLSYDRILPILSFLLFAYFLVQKKESLSKHYALLVLLGISWASSVSWGGMSPIQYFTPVLFSVVYLLKAHTVCLNKKNITKLIFCSLVLMSIFQNIIPYRDKFIWALDRDGLALSEKLAYVKISKEVLMKHQELKAILSTYKNTTILPSMPGAYYLYGFQNMLTVDWAMDIEVNYETSKLRADVEMCCDYVIIEKKNLGQAIGSEGKFYSSVTDYVINNFKLFDGFGTYFDIYIRN